MPFLRFTYKKGIFMSKNNEKNSCPFSDRLGKVGGQAVLEGVMMKAGNRTVTSCRKGDGSIVVNDDSFVSVRKKHKFLNIAGNKFPLFLFKTKLDKAYNHPENIDLLEEYSVESVFMEKFFYKTTKILSLFLIIIAITFAQTTKESLCTIVYISLTT